MAFFSGICLAFRFGTLIFLLNKSSLKTAQLNAPGAMVDDFFSGPILSWQKLKVFSEEWRRTLNRETGNEWFHWLAERLMEREKLSPPVPAYIAHRSWREPRRS